MAMATAEAPFTAKDAKDAKDGLGTRIRAEGAAGSGMPIATEASRHPVSFASFAVTIHDSGRAPYRKRYPHA